MLIYKIETMWLHYKLLKCVTSNRDWHKSSNISKIQFASSNQSNVFFLKKSNSRPTRINIFLLFRFSVSSIEIYREIYFGHNSNMHHSELCNIRYKSSRKIVRNSHEITTNIFVSIDFCACNFISFSIFLGVVAIFVGTCDTIV